MQQDLHIQASGAAAAPSDQAALGAGAPAKPDASEEAQSEAWGSSHAVNLRLTLPTPFGRYYVTLLTGKERRSPQRQEDERRKHPLVTTANLAFLATLGVVTGLALFAVIQFAARFVLERAGMV